jgi:hypothetical protein
MSRRFQFVLLSLMVLTAAAAAAVDTVSRVFTLRYVSVAEVSAAVQPMLSESGTLTLQPSQRRMTVQDLPDIIDRVAKLIRELDHVPNRYRIEVELLEGGPVQPYGTADEVEADERLRKMFKFPAYRRVGSAVLEGELGSEAQADLGRGFQISFLTQLPAYSADSPWGSPDPGNRIHLRGLLLQRLHVKPGGEQESEQVLRTTVLLSPNQKVYIGAGGSENAAVGWVLIIQAQGVGSK